MNKGSDVGTRIKSLSLDHVFGLGQNNEGARDFVVCVVV